ncbi:CsiV family protein [Pseudoalteromonas denitrificans]|uniref:Peptidoglycan-binding protein, CsiV n=1 Tax=Pseudoalteromonas denitrificans DSM 6059 TaxID=1123010 RepID=A0A1I1P8D8_9GAMM|nr:CsiV family protein [Pseudoalteromonas denitrificans]SFD05956.1 Peptidoglycan-binding protein, CsiV [Pseudoalteromonas denitrificans DSM 6059]
MMIKYILSISLLLFSHFSFANGRWYEVEVILFEHPNNENVNEDFSLELSPIKTSKALDLLSPNLQMMGQNTCLNKRASSSLLNKALKTYQSPSCAADVDYLSLMTTTPLKIDADEQEGMEIPYLITPEQLEFQSTIQRLKREGMRPILHTGWRQPGLTEQKAKSYRLYGGKNFSEQYDYFGNLKQVKSPFAHISDNTSGLNYFLGQIKSNKPTLTKLPNSSYDEYPDKTWQLDGLFKVFLRGRYLNIKAKFNLRQEDLTTDKLKNFHFEQFRRVISNEIHYFDHPKIGILVQIRRYMH